MFVIAIPLGIPQPLAAGAVVSGAYFGDKISPLSDTTIMASGATKTDLYSGSNVNFQGLSEYQ